MHLLHLTTRSVVLTGFDCTGNHFHLFLAGVHGPSQSRAGDLAKLSSKQVHAWGGWDVWILIQLLDGSWS